MRTRTLLLLAVGCGLLILVAGTVLLLQLTTQDEAAEAADVGEAVRIGDLSVTVEDASEADGRTTVSLVIGGVDDPDGADGFRLVVPGAALRATGDGDDACAGTTVATQRCRLVFDVSEVEGTSRVLLLRRGDEQVRWQLGGT